MRRFLLMLLLLVMVVFLSGCGATTTYKMDKDGTIIEKEVEHSFFASENYLAYLEAESSAQSSHERVFGRAADELIKVYKETVWATPVEARLAAINLSHDLKELSAYRGTGRQAPSVMADQNWPAWGQVLNPWLFALTSGGIDYERTDSPGNTIKGDHNTFIYKSGLGNGAGSQADIYLGDYSPFDVSTAGLSSPLSLDASSPYTYQPDNSRTVTETRTDSPSKSDNGIF